MLRIGLVWVEKTLYDNYNKLIYDDKLYFYHKLKYYFLKLITLKPIYYRIVKFYNVLKGYLNKKEIQTSTISELIDYYQELLPKKHNPGFSNRPLKDKRLEKIQFKWKTRNNGTKEKAA